MFAGTDTAYQLAKKYKIKTAFGTDILFSALERRHPGQAAHPPEEMVFARRDPAHGHLATTPNCSPSAARAIPTPASSASSRKAPTPTCCWSTATRSKNLDLVADPEKNFTVIMKDGVIYKNTLK